MPLPCPQPFKLLLTSLCLVLIDPACVVMQV